MAEKENLAEDDFEDLDFEDLDSEDAFEDESWDDFDESDDEADDEDESAAEDSDDTSASDVGAKKKGFVAKNFNLIVIGLAVLGGGGFFLTQLSGGSSSEAPAGTTATANEEIASLGETLSEQPMDIAGLDTDMPPMPAPIEAPEMQADPAETLDFDLQADEPAQNTASDLDLADTQTSSEVLTPLPELQGGEEIDLADLNALPEAMEISNLEENSDSELDVSMEDFSFEAPQAAPQESNDESTALTSDILDEDTAALATSPDAELGFENQGNVDDAQGADLAETQAYEQRIQALNATIADKDTALENARATESKLSANLQEANDKNIALEAQVKSLQKELNSLKAQPKSQPVVKPPAESAGAAEDVTSIAKAAPVDPAKKQAAPRENLAPKQLSKTEAKALTKPEWTLKSARPGYATLSSKDQGDLRQVEVGQTVPGLGKILDISVQDGRWVVRGSKASVSQ